MASTKYFNPIPLFILFREAIEASIVVAVLLTFLSRSSPQLKAQVWWGVAGGVGLSLICAGIFAGIFYVAQNNVFTGKNLLIFKGCMAWVACIFITYLAFAMLRYEGWEAKWERKLAAKGVKKLAEAEAKKAQETPEGTAEEGLPSPKKPEPQPAVSPASSDLPVRGVSGLMRYCWAYIRSGWTVIVTDFALFWVVFFTVLREGMESIIFLFGVGNADPVSIPISGLIGIACGIMVGVVLYYSGKSVKDIKWLLWAFAVVLFFIAAGSAELGAESLMYAGMFGPYVLPQSAYTAPGVGSVSGSLYGGDGQPPAPSAAGGAAPSAFNDGDEIVVTGPVDLNDGYVYIMTPRQPWWQEPLWDISSCCAETDDKNKFLALANTIFGYNANPTFIDAIFYLGYWFVTLSIGLYKWYRGRLLDADWKHTAMMRALRKKELDEQALRAKAGDTYSTSEISIDQHAETAAGPSSQPAVLLTVGERAQRGDAGSSTKA